MHLTCTVHTLYTPYTCLEFVLQVGTVNAAVAKQILQMLSHYFAIVVCKVLWY